MGEKKVVNSVFTGTPRSHRIIMIGWVDTLLMPLPLPLLFLAHLAPDGALLCQHHLGGMSLAVLLLTLTLKMFPEDCHGVLGAS